MASGARITLTSPDPSSNNAPQHTEHMIFSESDSDTVTFNAHKHNEMASHDHDDDDGDASTHAIDESTASTVVHSHPQKVEITIDSVAPYETDSNSVVDDDNNEHVEVEEEDEKIIQSSNRADSGAVEESEMNTNEHTNDLSDSKKHEKPIKNDEL